MKKLYFILGLMISFQSMADTSNHYLFGKTRNSVGISSAYGVSKSSKYDISIRYSQPNTVFRLPGRVNVEFVYFQDNFESTNISGVSQDIVFFNYKNIYFGGSIGLFIKDKMNENINSRLTFGEKAFLGLKINSSLTAEIFYRHFSNGDIALPNHGYNLHGLSLIYNF